MLNLMQKTNSEIPAGIEIFEQFLGKKLPKDYRSFLEKTNGGVPLKKYCLFKDSDNNGTIINVLFGITNNNYFSLIKHYNDYKGIIPLEMLPIGDDQGGNIVLLCISGNHRGNIYFLDHEKSVFLLANSFEEFINNLKSEEEIEALRQPK